jgi:TPR repeat protein
MPTAAQASPNGKAQPSTASSPTPIPVAPSTDNVVSPGNSKAGRSTPPPQPLTLAAHKEAIDAAPQGAQELLEAQRYLDGRGVQHDSGQAAALLWKAVSKQNARAGVLLADLYLRGDGVPKSCDQARLLLVAAAKKDAPGATEKLRNLESSGCR